MELINIVYITMFNIVIIFLVIISLRKDTNAKDEFLVNLSVLERVIDDYVQIVYNQKIEVLRSQHNLNADSKINSIKLFESKTNEVLKISTIEVINLLTRYTKKQLLKRFSSRSLALFISNKIRSS
jgi:hypothetical protein